MQAITIWQPWASLIVVGAKPYEFRGWPAPRVVRGQRIAIHAGARKVKRDEIADLILRLKGSEPWSTALRPELALPLLERWLLNPELLPLASIVGTAMLGQPKRAHETIAEFGGVANDSDRGEHWNWAWPLSAVEPVEPIVPARGAQGFWTWGQAELLPGMASA